MRTRLSALLLGSMLLLTAACSDYIVLEPSSEVLFHHRPGHGGGGGGGDGAEAGNYEVITLGTLGGSSSSAWAGNQAGLVVGSSSRSDGETRAFVWTEMDGMVELEDVGGARDLNEGGTLSGFSFSQGGFVYDLPTELLTPLPPLPDYTSTDGIAINDDGWVGGRSGRTLESGDPDWQTVVWIPDADGSYGEPLNLQCPNMQVYMDINQRGDVVANGCTWSGSPPQLWIWNGTGYDDPIALGTLGGRTMAVALDDHGRVAGWSTTSGSDRRAVLWHPSDYGAPIDLGSASLVTDMSNENQIVGSRSNGKGYTGIVWTVDEAGQPSTLHELPGVSGYGSSHPRGITDHGWIVGQVTSRSNGIAVLWRPVEDGGGDDEDCDPHPRFDRCK